MIGHSVKETRQHKEWSKCEKGRGLEPFANYAAKMGQKWGFSSFTNNQHSEVFWLFAESYSSIQP